MKQVIRQSVFETNSSSMHSLVVKKKDEYFTQEEIINSIYVNKNGVYTLSWNADDLYFGRAPFRYLTSFEDKLKYAVASLCGWKKNAKQSFSEIEDFVKTVVPGIKKIKLPLERLSREKNRTYYGSVDEDILTPFLEKEGITFKEFLMNKKYTVVVDGDERCIWIGMKEDGIINMSEIEREFPLIKENEEENAD